MMKRIAFLLSVVCLASLTASAANEFARHRPDELLRAPLGEVVFKSTFAEADGWKTENYKDRLDLRLGGETPFGADVLYVGGSTNACDTAWKCVLTEPRKLPRPAAAYVFSVEFRATLDFYRATHAGGGWTCSVTWLGSDGQVVGSDPLPLKMRRSGDWRRVWLVGRIPAGAAAYRLQLGYDDPNVGPGGHIAFRRLVFGLTDATWAVTDDMRPPRVKLLTPSPTADAQAVLRVSVSDESAVRERSVRLSVDGRDETANFTRQGDVWTLGGARTWTNGIHTVDVSATDWYGNLRTAHKLFLIGEKADAGRVEIRKDGKFTVDGKPFFPIGVYAVQKREFNGEDWDKALADLRSAGFNVVHSYGGTGTSPDFLAAVRKYGMRTWTAYKRGSWDEVCFPGTDFVDRLRHEPTTLAWYLADDTSGHQSPEELEDYDDAVKALDPNHPTAQADGLHRERKPDNYRDYVNGTDIFIPEIYPIRAASGDPDTNCVAEVICDMKRCLENVARFGDGRPKSILPVLQHFKGWGDWPRFPNADEEVAMTFAAVVCGASGVTWYTYGGRGKNEGITSTPARWGLSAEMAHRLGELAPAILDETVEVPTPEILSGPATDPLGNPSVSVLVKRHGGELYAISVNSRYDEVKARIVLPGATGTAYVLWEDRTLPAQGGVTDVFRPFAVHVYRIAKTPAAESVPALTSDGKGGFVPLETRPHELNALFGAGHVQGACCSERRIYLSHQRGIEVLDWSGKFVGRMEAPAHLGDSAYADGKIYAAFCLRGPIAGDKPGMIRVWDENFNLLKEKRFRENLDGITVLNGFVYAGVDTYGYPEHPEFRVKKLDLDLNEVDAVTIPLDFKVNYGVQTMTTDGKNIYCGMYGAPADKGNPNRYNFVELTSDLKFVRAARTGGVSEGFDRVPPARTGGKTAYLTVSSMGGNMQGWRKDPGGNPPRIRLWFVPSF